MVGFKDKLLFSHNKKELTKDLPYFDKVKVRLINDSIIIGLLMIKHSDVFNSTAASSQKSQGRKFQSRSKKRFIYDSVVY